MSKSKEDFYRRYAPLAMEQQRLFGIPASVTLAQMAIESSAGSSTLAIKGNNYFGVKGYDWERQGRPVMYLNDDHEHEPFRVYGSVKESVTDHSRVLMGDRYRKCHSLSPTDYKGWADGLHKAGYATDPGYASKIIKEIEYYNLQNYDNMALSMKDGKDVRKERFLFAGRRFSMPINPTNGMIVITSDFGYRNTGIKGASKNHQALDLRARFVPVLATEDGGRVIKAEGAGKGASGKHVVVRYDRDGHTYDVTYLHLDKVDVAEGDTVSAGQAIGTSGKSSTLNIQPHLDFRVRRDGDVIDPKEYLAEISVYGGLDTAFVMKNDARRQDVLLAYKEKVPATETYRDMASVTETEKPSHHIDETRVQDDVNNGIGKHGLMGSLLGSLGFAGDDMGMGMGGGLVSGLFQMLMMSLFSLALNKEEKKGAAPSVPASSGQHHQEGNDYDVRSERIFADAESAREMASTNFDVISPSHDTQQERKQEKEGFSLS